MPAPAFDAAGTADLLVAEGHLFAKLSDDASAAVQATFEAGRRFFRAPLPEKMSCKMPLDAGYRPYGVEYSASGSHPDEVESFTVCGRSDEDDVATLSGCGAALHANMSKVFASLLPPIAQAVTAISEKFGLVDLPSVQASLRQWSILQMNYARPSETAAEFINDEHEDGCLLTAMIGTGPGLEIRTRKGEFDKVTPSPGRVVLASGEILWLLTGGAVHPTYHRVRRVEAVAERMSLLLFADIGPDLCAPWVETEVNEGVDIGRRVLTNAGRYGLDEWEM